MSAIRQILAIVDPSTAAQPCVAKAVRLAKAFSARLELYICDNSPRLRSDHFYAAEFSDVAADKARAEHFGQLEMLAAAVRKQGINVTTDVEFSGPLHAGIIQKVRAVRPDLVVKDTHYHGPVRRTLFTNTDWHLIRECPAPLLLTKPIVWRSLVRFVAAIDPSHESDKPAALDHEILLFTERLATGLGGDMRAVHVVDTMPIIANADAVARTSGAATLDVSLLLAVRIAHQRVVDAVLAQHPNFGGQASVVDGAPVEALPEFAIANGVDVMIMGAVSRGALRALVVGRTAEKVMDRLPCDLLVWKPSQLVAQLLAAA